MGKTNQEIKALKDKLKALKAAAQDAILDIAKDAAGLIKKRTRLGFGVAKHGGKKTKLEALSTGYKNTRKRNKPSGPTTPSKSNLTNTGDMLNDIEAKRVSENKVEIGFSSQDSRDKAEWVSEDRPFNNLSKAEIKQLRLALQKRVNKSNKD